MKHFCCRFQSLLKTKTSKYFGLASYPFDNEREKACETDSEVPQHSIWTYFITNFFGTVDMPFDNKQRSRD